MRKCFCYKIESKIIYFHSNIPLCGICSFIVNSKSKENYENNKSIHVLDIIKEINSWDDYNLYKSHTS